MSIHPSVSFLKEYPTLHVIEHFLSSAELIMLWPFSINDDTPKRTGLNFNAQQSLS